MTKTNVSIESAGATFAWSDGNSLSVKFHRTFRLPEDGNTHALPPSVGGFPVKRVDDYRSKVPKEWVEHGGVFLPMWQREALWLSFESHALVHAVKIAAGKVNAVNGKSWSDKLMAGEGEGSKQDYMVAPPQPWLDGFKATGGTVRQFVAMPLGQGYSVEGQVTGEEKFGGIQIMVMPPKKSEWDRVRLPMMLGGGQAATMEFGSMSIGSTVLHDSAPAQATYSSMNVAASNSRGADTELLARSATRSVSKPKAAQMGLAAGGKMKQKIYPDSYGVDTWDESKAQRLYVHFVNSELYEEITGERPPATPITAQSYAKQGLPWYDVYDEKMGDLPESPALDGVKSVGEKDKEHGFVGQQDDSPVQDGKIHKQGLQIPPGKQVRDGAW
jgi:hypothetical protein